MKVTVGEGHLGATEAIVWRRSAGLLVAAPWFSSDLSLLTVFNYFSDT